MSPADALAAHGMRLQDLDEADSTNRIAAEAARAGRAEGLVVRARSQSAGRGRQGRSWVTSPDDALLVSFVRAPPLPVGQLPRYTLAVGLVVRDLAVAHGLDAWVKWPNDVLVGSRKLAGVLCEFAGAAVVVGVGLNLRVARLPEPLRSRAVGLEEAAPASRDAVLGSLAARLVQVEAELSGGGWSAVRDRCVAAMGPMIGAEVRSGGAPCVVRGLDPDGALRVSTDAGPRRIIAGDVHLGWEAS